MTDQPHSPFQRSELNGPHGCKRHEFGQLLDFVNYVFRSDKGLIPSMGSDFPHLYNEANCENFRRIRHNGRIVSCVNIYTAHTQWEDAILKIGGIGGVGTHPNYRRGGLAGLNLKDALDYMTRTGHDLSILWTGIGDYYRKFGWEDAGMMYQFDMNKTTLHYLPQAPSGKILEDPDDERVVDAVHTLHAAERRGIVRNRELTTLLITDRPNYRVKVLFSDDTPRAYAVYSVGNRIQIRDFGGEPHAVLGLVSVLCGKYNVSGAELYTPPAETGVVPILRQLGFPARILGQGMVAVLNPANIVQQYGIDDLTFEQTHSEGGELEGWRVTYNNVTCAFRSLDLVKYLFGPERPGLLEHPKLPLPFHFDMLDHM